MSFWDGVGLGDALPRAGFRGSHVTQRLDRAISYRARCKRIQAMCRHIHVHAATTNQGFAPPLKDKVEDTNIPVDVTVVYELVINSID